MPGEDIQSWSTTATLNSNADSTINWAEDTSDFFNCFDNGTSVYVSRDENPPDLALPEEYVSYFTAIKGNDVTRVRAASIIGGVPDLSVVTGIDPKGCFLAAAGPSDSRTDAGARSAGASAGRSSTTVAW